MVLAGSSSAYAAFLGIHLRGIEEAKLELASRKPLGIGIKAYIKSCINPKPQARIVKAVRLKYVEVCNL